MSITAAISNARSGLTAVSRGTEVTSSNIANALTPGYGARELDLSSRPTYSNGGGVHVNSVNRMVPAAILADTRVGTASLGHSRTTYNFHLAMESAIGGPGQSDSLNSLVTNFDTALASAASGPESSVRLLAVLDGAQSLANKLNSIGSQIQTSRTNADRAIANDVGRLNSALEEVANLNRLVTIAQSKGQDASALMDLRQAAITGIADIVPVQEVPRGSGQIALFTKNGAALLDGTKPVTLSFSPSGVITPEMSLLNGNLGSLMVDGVELANGQLRLFKGGSLEANFQIRDTLASEQQNQIDAYAQDLYRRLATTEVDPTLAAGDAGIFTDRQAALDPLNSLGFANRIQVTNAIDPKSGGELWRIRDGVAAVTPGDVGNSHILNNMRDALALHDSNYTSPHIENRKSTFSFASDVMSLTASSRLTSETRNQQNQSYSDSMIASLMSYGVDSDKEFEILLQLENAFTANAKVLQAAHEMLDTILRLK